MDYCRLCAELKDHTEIVTTIADVEQSTEEKLRACCQWTSENSDKKLPHSVCAICLDKLDKCWLFSQNVQLAQQKLHEIFQNETEIKPLISAAGHTIYDATEYSENHLPQAIAFEVQNCATETVNFQCNLCYKSFNSNRSLREHCKQHYENKCEIFSQNFFTATELNAHRQHGCEGTIAIASNMPECKFTDVICKSDDHSDSYSDDNDAMMVGDDFHGNEPNDFKSVVVAKKAPRKKKRNVKLIKPLKLPSNRLHRCTECGLTFSKEPNLLRHHAKHAGLDPFECWLCHKTFPFRYLMNAHFKTHPFTESELLVAMAAERLVQKRKSHKCTVCDRSFTKKSYLTRHHRTHTGERPFECDECGACYKEKYQLTAHRLIHADGQHECWLCHKMFTYKYVLKKHMDMHLRSLEARKNVGDAMKAAKFIQEKRDKTNDRSQSDVSGRIFKRNKWESKLKGHLEVHSNKPRPNAFECWLCHRLFKSTKLLKLHMKVHLKSRTKKGTCICELCGKVCINASFLQDHLAVHSDQRSHVCGICGLGYKTKRLLRSHHISHTEFQHKCTQCEKTFRKKESLRMHMETHSGLVQKPYVCDICGKGFRKNCDLVEHRRIHTGETPHVCEYCSMKFRTMSGYYTHLRKMHGVSVSARNREEQKRLTAMS